MKKNLKGFIVAVVTLGVLSLASKGFATAIPFDINPLNTAYPNEVIFDYQDAFSLRPNFIDNLNGTWDVDIAGLDGILVVNQVFVDGALDLDYVPGAIFGNYSFDITGYDGVSLGASDLTVAAGTVNMFSGGDFVLSLDLTNNPLLSTGGAGQIGAVSSFSANFDVTGGTWANLFDTNLEPNGLGSADFSATLDFTLDPDLYLVLLAIENNLWDFSTGINQINGAGVLALGALFTDAENIPHGTSHDEIRGNVVPEPSTVLLLGSGLLGLAFFRRKKEV